MQTGNLNQTRFILTNQRFLFNVNEPLIGLAAPPPASFICCAQLRLSRSFFLTFSCTSVPLPPVPKHASTPGLCPFTQLLWGHVRSFICKVTGCAFPPLQDTEFCRRRNRSFRPGRVLRRRTEDGPNCSWITLSRYQTAFYTLIYTAQADMGICAALPNVQFKILGGHSSLIPTVLKGKCG